MGRGAIWWIDIGRVLDRERAITHAQTVLEERKEEAVKKIPLKPVRVGQEANVFPPPPPPPLSLSPAETKNTRHASQHR